MKLGFAVPRDFCLGRSEGAGGRLPQVFHIALGLDAPARNYRDLAMMNRPAYVALTTALLHQGVRAFERGAWFMSANTTQRW